MKIGTKKLNKLIKQYNELPEDEKIISISDAKKMLDDIIKNTEKLEDLLSEQMDAIEVVGECDEDSCECGEVEQTELYDLYSDLEDAVLCGKLDKAARMID